ncbi:MAG: Hpt domain-containing protein, partial [Gammaproteobacteria bacterium]|nr:Hpt domain-containing protein [Gammaproteobacteria bacterium]
EDEQFVAPDIKPPTNQSPSQESSLDTAILEKFRIEMEEDYDEILSDILQGFDTFFTQFEDSTNNSDTELARSAHNLKSRSAHLGALKLCKIADEIEKLADNKEMKHEEHKIQQLKQEYDQVLADLAKVE